MSPSRARAEMAHDLSAAARSAWRALSRAWRLRQLLHDRLSTAVELGGAAARLAAACDGAATAIDDLRRVAVRAAEHSLRGAA